MEDDDFDENSTIGQLITNVNKICKKPQVDGQLSNVLETFQNKISRQTLYLNNGLFNINFAEAALFIQSCSVLYGKKIDLLWDGVLEFLTTLISSECKDQKEKGKNINTEAIKMLEERRNRYKRKKSFKLNLSENTSNVDYFLFDDDANEDEEPVSFEPDEELSKAWRVIEWQSNEITKIPRSVAKLQRQTYRMKNYYIMKDQDWDICDSDDGEVNTRYSKIPGWHVIYHLFEYNTLGLLPDKYNTIATLRLCCYLRAEFMRDRKIPFNAPYSQYKEEYLAFKKKFFEEESKKWQNMPLDTMADLRRQLDFLAQKDKEEDEKEKSLEKKWNVPEFLHKNCCTYEGCSDCSSSKSSIITISDSSDGDFSAQKEDITKCEPTVCLEKLSPDIVNSKLLRDSGYFDFDEDKSDEMEETHNLETTNSEASEQADKSVDVSESSEKSNETETTSEVDKENENADKDVEMSDQQQADKSVDENGEKLNESVENADEHSKENENPNTDGPNVCNVSQDKQVLKENSINKSKSNKSDDILAPMSTKSRIIVKPTPLKRTKQTKTENSNMEPPSELPKRRKLSQRVMEKLLKSKIKPVNEIKFEKFFSLNYQPQLGEGEILPVDYESEEDEVSPESILAPDDDLRSIVSDHNYTQLSEDHANVNDSGFIDEREENLEDNIEADIADEDNDEDDWLSSSRLLEERSETDPSYQAEYERLLTQLRESRKQLGEELQTNPGSWIAEKLERERERLAAKARIEQWKSSITPVLNNLKENDFDIHEYGTKIMDGLEVEECKPFKNIVENRSPAQVARGISTDANTKYICRYFIASLQLASTYNIELCGAKQGELSNNTLSVKLLKKDRYHEHLAEYNAPSEEDFREKLNRIRVLQSREIEDSQKNRKRRSQEPCTPSSSKKRPKNAKNSAVNPAKGKNILSNYSQVEYNADINAPSTSRSMNEVLEPLDERQFHSELKRGNYSTPQCRKYNRTLGDSS
ncbi:unnamed protein product [Phyllotreta striolata]|uniref:Condensin-2 complex subunit H2 C-terminal domain-containing protein n=1 Tax=Phyllotreta striolata TaxID=444603 RepID=A0A9N9TEW3_PHYSR|nr:unnamed protein product [Phyllotreta striolata]